MCTRSLPLPVPSTSHSCKLCQVTPPRLRCTVSVATSNVRFRETLSACSPVLKSLQVRGAHALSRMTLVLHRVCRARLLARPLASTARF